MTMFCRCQFRRRTASAVALLVGVAIWGTAPASAQQAKEPPPKEVTDGFFDVPAREAEPSWGLPAYLVTSGLAGLSVFLVCKSARRT